MHLAIQNLLIQARFFPSDAFSQHELLTKSFQLYVLITWRVQTFFFARARCLSAGLRYLRLTRLPRHDRGPVPGGNRSAASCLCTVLRRALYHYATRSPLLGEFKLLDVKDMLKDLNVQPMYVSSARRRLHRIRVESGIRCRADQYITFQVNINHTQKEPQRLQIPNTRNHTRESRVVWS